MIAYFQRFNAAMRQTQDVTLWYLAGGNIVWLGIGVLIGWLAL